jgi:mono/diheme cytochrome c family protein/plastocyanin
MAAAMKTSEWFSRFLIALLCFGVVFFPIFLWEQTPLIHAKIAENGGWDPYVITAKVGEPLHLKFTSDDVTHGFAVGQMKMPAVTIEPGKVSKVSLLFDQPGIYTFYCTRWCGLNHWRMRGTIEVAGDKADTIVPASPPLYVTLGLNLDAPHPVDIAPLSKPSALHGQSLVSRIPGTLKNQSTNTFRSKSPEQVFRELNASGLTDPQRWDVIAALWAQNTSPAGLDEGKRLFAQNCAACHGETGAGDGVYANALVADSTATQPGMTGAENMPMKKPVNFILPDLLGASPAILQGKILRGGMGTGMPMWGSIFSDKQLWNLVAYLYTFQFEQ